MTPDLVAVGFGLASLVLFIAAGVSARKTRRLIRSGLRSRAIVRELKTRELQMQSPTEYRREDPVYAPVFEFTAADGKRHRLEGDAASPPRYAVGDEVMLLYPAADPGAARVESFAGLWLGAMLALVGAGVTAGAALLIFWAA